MRRPLCQPVAEENDLCAYLHYLTFTNILFHGSFPVFTVSTFRQLESVGPMMTTYWRLRRESAECETFLNSEVFLSGIIFIHLRCNDMICNGS